MSQKIITTQEDLERKINQMKKKKSGDSSAKTKLNVFYSILLAFLIAYVICLLVPLFWSFISSFKGRIEFQKNVLGFPKKWEWNYGYVFDNFYVDGKDVLTADGSTAKLQIGMIQMYLYSIFYAVGVSFFGILSPCLVSYLCAKFNFRFNGVLVSIVLVTMVVPIVGSTPSGLMMSKSLGFYNHIWGMWLQSMSFLGSNFLVFMTMWRGIPKDFTEAAKVDGAGNFRILLQIMFPLAKNTFLTLMLLSFIGVWNDYGTPQLYMEMYPTAAYGLFLLSQKNVQLDINETTTLGDPSVRMAAAMTLVLPMLIVFCFTQKRLVGNLSMGGIKG